MTTNPGATEIFRGENAETRIYTHVEKEIASGTVDGSNKAFTVTTAPVSLTELNASALSQFVDASGDYFRKDVLVFYRKDGKDTVVDTNANAITISSTTLTFTTAPATADADSVVVSYAHTLSDRTDEIVSMSFAGGGRPVEYITVQGGTKVRVEKVQEARTVSCEVLSVDEGWVDYMNGKLVSETSGSDIIKGTVGAQRRGRKAMIVDIDDPETGNKRIECFHNIVQVSSEGSMPSEGHWSETAAFECPPQDYCRITFLNDQA